MSTVTLPRKLEIASWISIGGTILDGALSYVAIIVWELGREGNGILTSITSGFESIGLSHAEAFGAVMLLRVTLGVAMIQALRRTAKYQISRHKETWLTFHALPFVAGVFILLTAYHAVLLSTRYWG